MESLGVPQKNRTIAVAPDRATVLRNLVCVYCATPLTKENTTREHVIGRRFVPKGKFDGEWNLIVNACKCCNEVKANLEDDISAITLQSDLGDRFRHGDAAVIEEARRKAENARSRRTRKAVKDSYEQLKFSASLGAGVNASFDFRGPPQVEYARVFELAKLQLKAFFYWQTYDQASQRGYYWLHGFHPFMVAARSDWGNRKMTAFMNAIEGWEHRLYVDTADGYFKVITRKHPSAEIWAWAIEWNRNYRIVGFFGEREPAQAMVNSFPPIQKKLVYRTATESLSYHVEVPLVEDKDTLFVVPDAGDPSHGEGRGQLAV